MKTRMVLGDCIEKMKKLPDNSVDVVVTDPPYELGFMGKDWDNAGIAYNVAMWKACLRVLKPGGHLLSFGGTRTYHRMACAIEDAGFEIRDSIHWVYGSGFPKSLDVSKAIDKAAGVEREVVGSYKRGAAMHPGNEGVDKWRDNYTGEVDVTVPATDAARQWSGWGTALKPAHEPIVVARRPLVGTVAANVLAHGVGAINVDGCRVGWSGPEDVAAAAAASFSAGRANGTLTQSVSIGKESRDGTDTYHPDQLAGRWPPNVIFSHFPECLETECAERCAVRELDEQSGVTKSTDRPRTTHGTMGYGGAEQPFTTRGHADSGGASRFFPVFRYQAKASKKDRGEGNTHPTVKPVELMRWLVRLVTPPGGLILDPFTGSGTTGVAAKLEGFQFIGIEQSPEYHKIALFRIAGVTSENVTD